ncbi:hypothetical protein JIR001_14150 [Polycladomyces abyssicola]|uniref:Uncharacterized protein n=1 Tax=Polycladomyces abyssicola TaxID=1125966 RepID=A0A8D5ZN65_9BACL|nr:hypothetical protein [Polycladomyces abyssicola]BCU81632.1 hypothetical protein JIR001_14150 [Polycladomyces abyssicola]
MAIDKTIPLVVHVFNRAKVGKPVPAGEGCNPIVRLEPEESPSRVKLLGAFETRFLFNPNDVSEWRLAGRERQMTVPGSSSWTDRSVMHRAERFRDRRTVDGRKDGWSIASDCWKRFSNW